MEKQIQTRSGNVCELCGANNNLQFYTVPESPTIGVDATIHVCGHCDAQLQKKSELDVNHWRCLNDSMWSQVAAVQVVAFRMLSTLSSESWAQDLLDMLYLEDDVRNWAEAGLVDDSADVTLDSNGDILQAGDNVHLIKDLNVKGANFTAKRGTPVRNIALSANPLHIEGKINGQRIVLIAAYTKKS